MISDVMAALGGCALDHIRYLSFRFHICFPRLWVVMSTGQSVVLSLWWRHVFSELLCLFFNGLQS